MYTIGLDVPFVSRVFVVIWAIERVVDVRHWHILRGGGLMHCLIHIFEALSTLGV